MIHIGDIDEKDVEAYSALARGIIGELGYPQTLTDYEMATYTPEKIREARANGEWMWVALKGNEPLGFLHAKFDAGTAWLNWLGVVRSKRQCYVGHQLFKHLVDHCKKVGVHKIWFDSYFDNHVAETFFTKQGARVATILRNHWANCDFYLWEYWL